MPPYFDPNDREWLLRMTSLPRGIRNNNPGNIEFGKFTQSRGAVGSDGRFAKFPTPEQGISAMHDLLGSYQNRGLNTVERMIGRWAPSSENNTSAYARAVSQRMGVKPSQPIDIRKNPDLAAGLIEGMIQHENGMNPFSREQIANAIGNKAPPPSRPDVLNAMPRGQQAPARSYRFPQSSQVARAYMRAPKPPMMQVSTQAPFAAMQSNFQQSPIGQAFNMFNPPAPATGAQITQANRPLPGAPMANAASASAANFGANPLGGMLAGLGSLAGDAAQQQQTQQQTQQQHQQTAAQEQQKRALYAMQNWGWGA